MTSFDPRRPNVLFVLSDDQGPWALGCAGNDEIETPVIDRLAAEGTRLSGFCCASPVCSPARASLLTGTIPSTHGVHDWLTGDHVGPGAVDYVAGLPLVTDAIAAAGYRIGLSGKWHLGASDRPRPGFAHWFALEAGGSRYGHGTFYRGTNKNDDRAERVEIDGYLTETITDDALAFLSGQDDHDQPWCAMVTYTAPHSPWAGEHPEEFTHRYEDCSFDSCPDEAPHPWLPTSDGVPIGGERDVRAARIGYFAAVTAMDAQIGRLLEHLERTGADESTIVIFASDNGFNLGHHGVWGKGNGTYPQNMYDSSIMVPFIARGPGIEVGAVRDELASGYDVAATLLDLCGLDQTPFETGAGASFAALLRDPSAAGEPGGRSAYEQRPVIIYDEYGPVRMIRTTSWKYVHRYPDGPDELYDLTADPGERINLAGVTEHAAIQAELARTLAEWFARYGSADHDGAGLPVSGSGQQHPVDQPHAFLPGAWDAIGGKPVNVPITE